MAVYDWKGKNQYGDLVSGRARRRFDGRADAPAPERTDHRQRRFSAKRGLPSLPFLKRERVKLKELAVYSRQLSVLIDAELPLIQSLGILADQQKNRYFKRVINEIKEDVEAGSTLHQAKRKHPKVFDDLYCNLVASGEQSGSLDIMLRRLAEYIENNVKLRAQVRQAMIYPVAIVIFALVVAIFLLWKVIPVVRLDLRRARRRPSDADGLRRQAEQFRQSPTSSSSSWGSSPPSSSSVPTGKPQPGRWTTDRMLLKIPSDRESREQDFHRPPDPDAEHSHRRRRADARKPQDHLHDHGKRPHRKADHGRPEDGRRGKNAQ